MGFTLAVLDNGFGGAASWSTFTATAGASNGYSGSLSASETMKLYVANGGSDTNGDGFGSSSAPYATPDFAFSKARIGSPDWVLFKEGDTFTSATGFQMFGGGLNASNYFLISSWNPADPTVPHPSIGVRPIIQTPNGVSGIVYMLNYVGVVGIELYSYERDPDNPAYVGAVNIAECTGLYPGNGQHVVMEDNKISWYSGGIENPLQNGYVYMNRNIIHNILAYASRPHSIGIENFGNLECYIQENFLDYCGWNPDGTYDIFSRNMYLSGAPLPFLGATRPIKQLSGNTSIRCGSGDQTRVGAEVGYNNYFAHFAYGPSPISCQVSTPVGMTYNVLQTDDTPQPGGCTGVSASLGGGWTGNRSAVTSSNNIVTDISNYGALCAFGGTRAAVLTDNIAYRCVKPITSGDTTVISNGFTGNGGVIDYDTPAGTGYDGTGALTLRPARNLGAMTVGDTYTSNGNTFTMLGSDGRAEDALFVYGTSAPASDHNANDSTGAVTISGASGPAVLTHTSHGLVAGDAIHFYVLTGTVPTGMADDTVYFVIASGLGANSFEISLTSGGSAVTITDNGSGTFGFNNVLVRASGSGPTQLEWTTNSGVLYLFNVNFGSTTDAAAYQDYGYQWTNNGHTYTSINIAFGPACTQMCLYSTGGLPSSSGTLVGVGHPNIVYSSVDIWYQCVAMKTAGNNRCHVNLVTDVSGNVTGVLPYSGIPGGGQHIEWGPAGSAFSVGDSLTPVVSFAGGNASCKVATLESVTVSGNATDTSGTNAQNYRDPNRSAETYNRNILGGAATMDSFSANMKLQRKGNWNPLATSASLNDYMRQGFTPVGQTVVFQGSAYADSQNNSNLIGGGPFRLRSRSR